MRWWLAGGSVVWVGCVVVSEPNIDQAGMMGPLATESSTASSAESSSDGSEAPPLVAADFEVLWAVSPSGVAPPADSVGTIRVDVYEIPAIDFGVYPGALKGPDVLYAEIDAGVALAIPNVEAAGFGVLPRPSWALPWCDATDTARTGFAGSTDGQGLEGAELAAAYEAAGLEILLEFVATARSARPKVAWGFRGVPWPDYWDVVEHEDDNKYEAWRTCNVYSPAPRELWEAVDFTAPELLYFYSVRGGGTFNASYVSRWVEAMRLAGKPVYPVLEGRFFPAGVDDDSVYIGLPYYPEDVELVLTELRNAGANGLIYDLDLEGCWDFENGCTGMSPAADPLGEFEDYWMSAFSPVLATFDEM